MPINSGGYIVSLYAGKFSDYFYFLKEEKLISKLLRQSCKVTDIEVTDSKVTEVNCHN